MQPVVLTVPGTLRQELEGPGLVGPLRLLGMDWHGLPILVTLGWCFGAWVRLVDCLRPCRLPLPVLARTVAPAIARASLKPTSLACLPAPLFLLIPLLPQSTVPSSQPASISISLSLSCNAVRNTSTHPNNLTTPVTMRAAAAVLALAAVAVKAQSGPQNYSSSLDMTIDPNTIDASERGESKPSGTSQI